MANAIRGLFLPMPRVRHTAKNLIVVVDVGFGVM
jgi:hypothetical protein